MHINFVRYQSRGTSNQVSSIRATRHTITLWHPEAHIEIVLIEYEKYIKSFTHFQIVKVDFSQLQFSKWIQNIS